MLPSLPILLLAFAPTATTSAPTNLTTTSVTLNGTGNPRLEAATGFFRLYTVNPGACSSSSGTRVPASGGSALGSGDQPVAFSQPVAGLTSGATYWFCAFATNATGTAMGSVLSFTASPPPVTTDPAFSVGGSSARLAGTVGSVGVPTTGYYFRFSTSAGACGAAFGTRVPASGNAVLGLSGAMQNPVTGITAGSTYWFCAVAENSAGTSYGAVRSFTVAAPVVTTTAATQAGTVVTLNGSANPQGHAGTGWFRYSNVNPGACNDTFGTRLPNTGGVSVGAESSPTPYGISVSTLVAGTTVWFCAIAQNSMGTSFGAPVSHVVQAPPPPAAVTSSASVMGGTSIRFTGTATGNGTSTTAWIRYSTVNPGACDNSFGTRIPLGGAAIGSGSTAVGYSADTSTFTPGVTIWFCAVAMSATGTALGQLRSITPGLTPAGVMTLPATDVAAGSATVNGLAQSSSGGEGWFRYSNTDPGSCNDTFGTRVPASGGIAVAASQSATPLSAALAGLAPAQTLYFCAIAANQGGATFGVVHHSP